MDREVKPEITIFKQQSTGQNVLRIQEITYKDGLENGRRTGFLNIQPGADPNKVLEAARKKTWAFGALNRQTGLNTVSAVEASEPVNENQGADLVHAREQA